MDKFCKDCKHHFLRYCELVPKVLDPATGVSSDSWEGNVYYQRNIPFLLDIIDRACGRRGRFWESKE